NLADRLQSNRSRFGTSGSRDYEDSRGTGDGSNAVGNDHGIAAVIIGLDIAQCKRRSGSTAEIRAIELPLVTRSRIAGSGDVEINDGAGVSSYAGRLADDCRLGAETECDRCAGTARIYVGDGDEVRSQICRKDICDGVNITVRRRCPYDRNLA